MVMEVVTVEIAAAGGALLAEVVVAVVVIAIMAVGPAGGGGEGANGKHGGLKYLFCHHYSLRLEYPSCYYSRDRSRDLDPMSSST